MVEILTVIQRNPRITPAEIAEKIEVTVQYVRNVLRVLAELKLVETPVRGVYRITDLGKYVLDSLHQQF